MTRIIKFRAWDSIEGRMHLVSGINNTGSYDRIWEVQPDGETFYTPNMVLMQFIGVTDRNGNEIYEGDVVCWYVNDVTRTAPVRYFEEQGCFWMAEDRDSGFFVLNDWMRGEYAVIGHIYEPQ